jgi:dephospho-CoA kinase
MLNVGLTGGIACGKSTVADMFVRRGAHLIDFDKLAHEVQEPGQPAWIEVVNYFGSNILDPGRIIDRNKLAAIVFNDPVKLKVLNNIVHPHVFDLWQSRLDQIRRREDRAIILSDIPLLFEEKKQSLFDLTVLVITSPEEQICRLMARNSIPLDEARLRQSSQMPIGDKIKLADIVIDNQGTIDQTERKVEEVWRNLLQREKNKIN